jgi:hypothetical protein
LDLRDCLGRNAKVRLNIGWRINEEIINEVDGKNKLIKKLRFFCGRNSGYSKALDGSRMVQNGARVQAGNCSQLIAICAVMECGGNIA